MRINIFNCAINISIFNDMLEPTKLDNKLWCNHENAPEHAQAPNLVESNLQANIPIHLEQPSCHQKRQHIVINRISYHNKNHDQRAALINETSNTNKESKGCKTLVYSSSASFALLPILDMTYIEPSEAHAGKLIEGSNSNIDKPNNGTKEDLTNYSELRELFKLNQLGLQLEQTKSSTSKLHSFASEYSKSSVNPNMERLKINRNDCRNECKNLHELKQAESESCFRLTSIEESEELPKRTCESRNTFKNNDTVQVGIKGNNSGVRKGSDSDQMLARRVGKLDREGDEVVKVGAEAEQMKIQHLQEHNQQLRRRQPQQQQQQIQLPRAEVRSGCRQQVDAITASSSASIAKIAVATTEIETETATATVVAETETETETETTTRTGFQVEARLKALRPNQQADKFVVKAANFEHDLADKQRQQVFCCMLHSRLSLSSPSPSSCSSSPVTPFSSLSIQSALFQCYHREQSKFKSNSFVDSKNLNNKKRENYFLERARSGSRLNKQREIASSCKKKAQARGDQSSIKNLSTQKNYKTSSALSKQNTLVSTTKVQDPSSILFCNKVFYPNNQHNNSAITTIQKLQSNHLQKRQSKIEQQKPDTYLKRNSVPQVLRREQIRRPRRRKRPLCVDRIREQIKRQGVAKKCQKDVSCLLAQQQETTTNELVTPNFVQLTNNNGMIFEDSLNNNSSQGVTKKCSPSFYNNNTDDNKGRHQELITHKRSSPSSSSSSSSSSTTTTTSSSSSPSSSSSSLALSSPSTSFKRYNTSSLNAVTNSQDKRPLLGEGGLLTNRLVAFDKPLSVGNHTFQPRIDTVSFNSRQRNRLKTIAEVNAPNSLPQSSAQHHPYQANDRRDIKMTDQDNSDCEYLVTNNLHPLEILDQQTRMCISIYDPLPKPNSNNNNLEESSRKNCVNSDNHLQNVNSIDKNGDKYSTQIDVRSTTRRRQFDKGKENWSYEYSQSNYKTRQVDHLSGSDNGDQKASDADHDDEKHEDEEERLRESFPLELRKPIIDLPLKIMGAIIDSNSQQQKELFDPEPGQVGLASLVATESRGSILIVTIESEGNQTKPLHLNPSWTFEELVENVHRELSRLKEETLNNSNSNKFQSPSQSQSKPQTTATTYRKTATKLYEEARELAKILHSHLASSSREYVEGFISPMEHLNNHREPLIDPTAMSLSDRARMVGQVEKRGCVEMNEEPCWARTEQQSNENNLKHQQQKEHSNVKCDLQNEQKFAIMDYNQNRRLQSRVSSEDRHSRMKSDRDASSFEHKQSGASGPLSSSHLILPLPHPHLQPHYRSHPLPASSSSSSSSFRSSPDWRQTHLRRSQNRTLYNSRYLSNISNVTASMNIKDKCKGAEFGVAVSDENIAEQTRLTHYLQFEPSCNPNLPLCRQRKCSCITRAKKRPFSYNQNSTINLNKIADRVMLTKSNDNEKATTSRQDCNSFVTENNRKIDHTTSNEFDDAFSHVFRQPNKSSSSSFSSYSLQVNKHLNRQDNHSTDYKSSTLTMHPVWQTRNKIAETERETPDKQKYSDINQTRNKKEITKSGNDQEDSSLKVKQQMAKKQITSRPLSYARTVLANKDELTNRTVSSSPIVINDHNADLNADADSSMSNLAEPTTRLQQVTSTVSNNSTATTNLCKQGKVDNLQICVKNQNNFGKRLPKETKENENENEREHENRNGSGNENEDVDPNFKVYLNKEKSGSFGVARMTLESAELCQEEKESLLTQHDGQVATNLRAANSYTTALALLAPTSLAATSSKTASLLKRQVGTACFCRIRTPIESRTQSKVKIETEAQTSLITSLTQNQAPAPVRAEAKTKTMPSNQTRLNESICSGLSQGQQKQATTIKLGGDDNNQLNKRCLFSVSEPALTTSVHGDILKNNCSSRANDKEISVESTPASGYSMRSVVESEQERLSGRNGKDEDEEEEEENVGSSENKSISKNRLQVKKHQHQQRRQRNALGSEAKDLVSEQFDKRKVVSEAVARVDSLEEDDHVIGNGRIECIRQETKDCSDRAAPDFAAQPTAGVGCATRVKVFCPISPANNNKWACLRSKEKEKEREKQKEEANRGAVRATTETTPTAVSNAECTNNSNSWATGKSQFAGMKSAGDKEDTQTESEKVSFGKVSLLKGDEEEEEEEEESRRRRRRLVRQTERQQQQRQQTGISQVLREKQSIENEDKVESTEDGDKKKAGKVDSQANWSLSASLGSKLEATPVAGVATSPQFGKQVSWNGAVLDSAWAVAGRQKEKKKEKQKQSRDQNQNQRQKQRQNEKQRQPVGQAAQLSAIQLSSSTVKQRNRNRNKLAGMTSIAGEATIMNTDDWHDDDYDEREDENITASNSDTIQTVVVSEVGAEVGFGVVVGAEAESEAEAGSGSRVAKACISTSTPTTDATTNTTTTNTCITDCKTSEGRSQAQFLFSQRQQVNSSNGNGNGNGNSKSNSNSYSNNSIADTKQNSNSYGHSSEGSTTTEFRERNSNSYSNSHSQSSGNGGSKSNGGKRHRNNSSSASLAGIDCISNSNNDISPSQASSSSPSSSSLTHKSSLPSTSKQPLSFALIVTQNNNRDGDVKFVLDKNNNDNNNQQRSVDNNYNIDSNATSKLNKVACLGLDKEASSETTRARAAATVTPTLVSTTTTTSNKKTKKHKQKQKNLKTGSYQKQSVEEAAVGVAVSFTTQNQRQKQKIETETAKEKEAEEREGEEEEAEAKAGVEVASDEKQDRIRKREAREAAAATARADEKYAEEAQVGLEVEAQAQTQPVAQAKAKANAEAQAATTTKTNDNNPYCNNIQADIFKRPSINHSHNNTNYYLNDVATNSAKRTTFQQPTTNITSYAEVSSSAALPKPQPKPPSSLSSSTTITSILSNNINKLSNIDANKEQNNFIHSVGSNQNIDTRQRLFNSCYHLATISKNSISTTSNQLNNSYSYSSSSLSSSNTYFNSSDKNKVTPINTKNKTTDEKRQSARNENSNYSVDKKIRENNLTSGNSININENNPINLSLPLSLSQSHLNNSPKMTKSLSSEDTQTSSVKKFGSNDNNNHQDTIYGDRGAPIKQITCNNNNNTSANINNTKRTVFTKTQPQQQQSFNHSPSSETTTLSSPIKTSNNKMNPIESDPIGADDSPKREADSNPPLSSTTDESSSTYTSTVSVNTASSSSSSLSPEQVGSNIKQAMKHHSMKDNDSTTTITTTTTTSNDNDSKMSINDDVNNSSSCNINSNEERIYNKSSSINGKSHSGLQQSPVQLSASATNNKESQQTKDTSLLPNQSPSSASHDNLQPKQQQSQDANQNQHSAATAANNKQRVPSQPPANNRSILIIREIDPKSPESSVRDIFNSENCPSKPVHCDYALHNSWYVTFKDDEDAKLALAYIRKYIVTWNGQPIMARIKPKPAVPSASNQPPSNIVPPMVMQATTGQQQQLLQQISQQPQQQHVENGTSPETGVNISAAIAPSVAAIAANHHQLIAAQPQASVRVLGAPSVTPLTMNPAAVAASTSDATNPAVAAAARAAAGIGYMRDPNQNHPMLHHLSPMVPHAHHHHHHHHHHQSMSGPHHYGYSAVAFYGQHGPILTPWHYSNAPQYDLSEVFIYNGLTPFPSNVKSTNNNSNSNGNSKMITGGVVSSAALLGGSDHMTAAAYHHHHHHHNHQNANHLTAGNPISTPIVFGNNGGSGSGVVVVGGGGGGGPAVTAKGVNKSNHQRNDNHKEFKSNTPTIGSSNGAVSNNNHHHSHHNHNHHHHNQHHQQQHLSNQTNSNNSSSLQPNVSTNSGGAKRNRNNLVSNKNNSNNNNNNNNNSNNGNSNNVSSSYNTAQQQASTNSNNQQTSSDNEHLPGRPNRSS